MDEKGKIAFIGIGSNLGRRKENIKFALKLLKKHGIKILKVSTIIETEPYGLKEQPKFLNCVASVETTLNPSQLLKTLLSIENELGRVRTVKWGPRTIDLDILFYDELVIKEKGLTIPHPDLENRIFVLKPLCEIAPDFVHPTLKKTVKKMLLELVEKSENSNLEC